MEKRERGSVAPSPDEARDDCDAVLEAFLAEARTAHPDRVRRWIDLHPQCRVALLQVAARLAVSTAIGQAEMPREEWEGIRGQVVARARAISEKCG